MPGTDGLMAVAGGPHTTAAKPLQVVMLGVGEEIFAIEAGMVREILDPVPMTRVPGARAFVAALINVRGNIIPLADLRVQFGMPLRASAADTRIVVVEIVVDGDPLTVAILADKVYEVTEISIEDIQPTPRLGVQWKAEFIQHIARWNGEFIIVPDMGKILN